MKQIIRDYLTFNKREKNGVFVLLSIIFLMIVYLNVSAHFYSTEKINFSKFESEIAQLNAMNSFSEDSIMEEHHFTQMNKIITNSKAERFMFDPNNLSDVNWKRLGLFEKQIRTIKNYEAKGGKFKKKEDVKKMYCIKNELYVSLEPYIKIVSFSSPAPSPLERGLRGEVLNSIIELNSTDSAQLTTIKGIGPFYAKSIIKYRNLLGGFVKKEQLMEVWKFDQEKYNAIEKYISVDSSTIKKININTYKVEELKHPYITWNIANAIVNYRNVHGKFKTIDDIRKTDLVDEETLRKIAPYLVVDIKK